MTDPWEKIATVGTVLTALAVAPFLFGMVHLTSSMSTQNVDVTMVEQSIYLLVGAVTAIAPLTAVVAIFFVFFQYAEARA
jgi:hypothetical protein